MQENILKQRVFQVISQVMNIPLDQINEDSAPENLKEWDSLQHMNLILALEEEFKIKFLDDEIADLTDVQLILKALSTKDIS